MTPELWDRLMRIARVQARLTGQRARVTAKAASARMMRVTGSPWEWSVDAPEPYPGCYSLVRVPGNTGKHHGEYAETRAKKGMR